METKHIYWFAYFNTDEPSVRYRAKYALEKLNTDYRVTYDLILPGYRVPLIYKFVKTYFSVLLNRKPGSTIVFEKIHTQRLYATALKLLLRLRPSQTLYDIDDADYLKFPPRNINHFMMHSAKCAAGSNSLASYIMPLNKNVFLLTSPVIEHSYIKTSRNKLFTIGWIGYYNAHRESLMQLFFPALRNIAFPVKLILMGVTKQEHRREIQEYFAGLPNVSIDMPAIIDWQDEASVYKQIAKFDVGVAPLLDTEINRAKSAFKLKQYMSCGIPVLASNLGENTVFLKHKTNGFVCTDTADFAKYLKDIKAMSDANYWEMAHNALSTTETFSMKHYCETLLHQLNN